MSAPLSLSPGDRLGRYQIVALLGVGGMGEVYRARDPHLKRDVALKIVRRPSAGAEQLARFTREARAASSLNHPNIVAVYDAGVEDGTPYVVTELLEGETLRARLDRGPLPFRKAVDYGIQIAQALDAAHAGKIWHRDVKPANAFIMHDGRVKLLDFGIAKLGERNLQAESDEPTSDLSASQEVFGTAGYMSPEQVLGKPVDHRTDIFALGAVLYEMFTRSRAFKRASNVDTMHAVLHEDPADPLTLSPGLPPMAAAIVRRCLEKNKEERFQSARDLAFDLQQLRDGTGRSGALHAPSLALRRRLIPAIVGALLLFSGVAIGIFLRPAPDPPVFEQLTFRRARIGAARFVSEGRGVVYSEARESNTLELLRLDLADGLSTRLNYSPGSEVLAARAGEIALSVDRRFLMGERFVGTLAVAPVGGGAPRKQAENVEDADWDPSGTQLALVRSTGGMGGRSRLEYPLGTPRHETQGGSIRFPRVSRDGRRIAFLEDTVGAGEGGYVAVINLDGDPKAVKLTDRWRSVRGLAWSVDGKEIWFTAGDSRTNRVLRAVTPGGRHRVVMDATDSLTLWDIAEDGRVLLSRDEERRSLVGVPPGQSAERDFSWLDDSGLADVSDDGQLILFSDRFGVHLQRTDRKLEPERLGLKDAYGDDLSPDGTSVLATSLNGTELIILPRKVGSPQRVPPHNIVSYNGARWFPKDSRILFSGREAGHDLRSYVQDVTGGAPTPLTPENIWAISISPDGTSVAAIGDSQPGISIWPVPAGPSRLVPGSEKGDRPVSWSDDGKLLWIFRRGEVPAQIFRLDIATGRREHWKTLVPSDVTGVYSITEFAITPSGSAYFYSYRRLLSQLYVVRGIR
ncbi:MAG TPA: WD40 repeat domain-containing serine/threonine protein kinase [Vicinamibacterales bacterium]|nr:WD40 repeat domain-containing serine/threonine protein kinase [Vicinamibacterales bacterium]